MAFLSCASDFSSPLFRLLDDYETHRSYPAPTRSSGCKPTSTSPSSSTSLSTRRTIFMPAFDVRELNDAYYLDGELPGVDQSNIDIEFTDPQTLVVKGRTERNYHHSTSTSTSSQVELEPEQPRGQDTPTTSASRTSSPSGWHQPTVEDDDEDDEARSTSSSSTRSTARSAVIVEKPSAAPAACETSSTSSSSSSPKKQKQEHYWVAERSIGEFQRTFAFATRVDQDGVRAALKNGILSIVVPKEAAPKTKKIRVY